MERGGPGAKKKSFLIVHIDKVKDNATGVDERTQGRKVEKCGKKMFW